MTTSVRSEIVEARHRWVVDWLLLFLLLLALYSPVLYSHYAYSDDFIVFFGNPETKQVYLEAGRPLLALVQNTVNVHVDRVALLPWLRAMALLGTFALSVTIYHLAGQLTKSRMMRFSIAISIVCLPSVTVLVAWATCWVYPWLATFALWSGMLAQAGIASWRVQRTAAVTKLASALLIIVLVFFTYQVSISWFWIVPLVAVLSQRFTTNRWHQKRVLWLFAFGTAAIVVCFVLMKVYFASAGFESQARTGLLQDVSAKIYWLFRVQLPMVYCQWQVMDVSRKGVMIGISAISFAVTLCGFLCFLKQTQKQSQVSGRKVGWKSVLLWMLLAEYSTGMAHLHWFAIDANVKNYRIAGTLAACVTLLLFWSILQIGRLFEMKEMRHRFVATGSLILGLMAIYQCNQNLNRFWITPYTTAYQFTVDQIKSSVTDQTPSIHLIRQADNQGIVQAQNIYNFGRPFSNPEWIAKDLIRVAGKEAGLDLSDIEVTDSLGDEPFGKHPGKVIVDMRKLMEYRK